MSEMRNIIKRSNYHGWLPRYPEVHRAFIKEKVTRAIARKERERSGDPEAAHSLPVARFAAAILGDTTIRNLFDQIFLQVNTDSQV